MQRKRGQFSVEYMMTIAIGLTFLLIFMSVYFYQTKKTQEDTDLAKLEQLGNEIIAGAETVYYSGDFSQKTFRYNSPGMLQNISVQDRELVFRIRAKGSDSDLVFYSNVPLEGIFKITNSAGFYAQDVSHIYAIKQENNVLLCTNLGCEE